MTSSAFVFAKLLHALDQNLAQTTVLLTVIHRHGTTHDIELSWSELAQLSPGLARSTAHRAMTALIQMGIVLDKTPETAHTNATRRFRVQIDKLRQLLQKPLPEAAVLPGITHIPALDELVVSISHNQPEVIHNDIQAS